MGSTHLILITAVLATSSAAVSPNFPFSGLTPYAYSNFGLPRNLPFRPLFSYAYQADAPSVPLITPTVPATTFSRMIYQDGASSKTSPSDMFRGFSYQTRYTDGGRSEVIFVTGPESKKLMEQNVEYFRSILFPPSRVENTSQSGDSHTPPPADARTKTDSTKTENKALPIPNLQQSSVYRFQLFPAHTSPLLGNPLPLHSIINSYFQSLGHSPLTTQEINKDNSDQYNVEAQESMISELGRILAPDTKPGESESAVSQSQGTSSNSEESNSVVDVPTSSNAPDTTQASTSESNSPSTELTSTDNSVASSNDISSIQTQETSTTEQASTSTEEAAPASSDASTSTEITHDTTVQSSSTERNETTSTDERSEETTTPITETLAESA